MYPQKSGCIGAEYFAIQDFTVPHPYSAGKNIIENASFHLCRGEIIGLAGLVGSGRSELVRAIFGSLRKKSGTITLEGKNIEILNAKMAVRYGIALLTEDRKKDGFVGTMTIKENMTLPIIERLKSFIFLNKDHEKKITANYVNKLRIKCSSAEAGILSMSGGNQQKVLFSKWLLTDPKVLILDEPTRGVDVGAKSEIYKLIVELADSGVGIIMISSEMPELIAMCDRFLIINNGKIVNEMNKDHASEHEIMHQAAFG